jgi:hypothetical protein
VNKGTIDGQGYIYRLDFNNQGTVDANVSGGTLNISDTTTTNGGVLRADAGATLNLNGGFTSDIVTNGATILLDGTAGAPKVFDQNGNNALANFAMNTPTGGFTICPMPAALSCRVSWGRPEC